MTFFKKKSFIASALAILAFLVLAGLYVLRDYSALRSLFAQGMGCSEFQKNLKSDLVEGVTLGNGDTLFQTFSCADTFYATVIGLVYRDAVTGSDALSGAETLDVALYDADTSALLCRFEPSAVIYSADHMLYLAPDTPLQTESGHYYIEITPNGFSDTMQILPLLYASDVMPRYANGVASLNGVPLSSGILLNLSYSYAGLIPYVKALCVLLVGCGVLLLILALFVRGALWARFLGTLLILSVLFSCVFVPFNTPDEDKHFETAYYYAAVSAAGDSMAAHRAAGPTRIEPLRPADVEMMYYGANGFSGSDTLRYLESLRSPEAVNMSQATLDIEVFEDSFISYLPSILAIRVGLWLHLSLPVLVLAVRFANLLFYALCCTAAVALVPFGQSIVIAVSLLPMSLQLSASCANDIVSLGASIFMTALLFRLAMQKRFPRIWEYLPLLFASWIFFIAAQYHILLLWGAFAICCILSKFPRRVQRILWLAAGAGVLLVLAAWACLAFFGSYPAAPDGSFGLRYPIYHPLLSLGVLASTLHSTFSTTLVQILGGQLGWLAVKLDAPLVCGLFLLLALAVGFSRAPEAFLKRMRAGCILAGLGIALAAYAIGFVWTTYASYLTFGILQGIQGRYMLPGLCIFLFGLCPKKCLQGFEHTNVILGLASALNILVLLNSTEQILLLAFH